MSANDAVDLFLSSLLNTVVGGHELEEATGRGDGLFNKISDEGRIGDRLAGPSL